jgi:hypothetical protein
LSDPPAWAAELDSDHASKLPGQAVNIHAGLSKQER